MNLKRVNPIEVKKKKKLKHDSKERLKDPFYNKYIKNIIFLVARSITSTFQ